jgi:hypothetical protein
MTGSVFHVALSGFFVTVSRFHVTPGVTPRD